MDINNISNDTTENATVNLNPTGKVAIRLRNVSKTFTIFKNTIDIFLNVFVKRPHKTVKALQNINLDIYEGEVLGLIGYNGSGKTTLLKIIAGILVPDDNSEVEVNGTIGTMIALGSGFVDELTGRENIFHRAELLGISKQDINERIDKIIEFSSLNDRIDDKIKTYSSGMKARLGFAFYAFIDPDIMIVDEITAVGDIKFKSKAKKVILDMFKSGKTILFVSHNLNEIVEYCSRAVVIKNGKILEIGDPATLVNNYKENKYL